MSDPAATVVAVDAALATDDFAADRDMLARLARATARVASQPRPRADDVRATG
jgi:hypothetical protein